ncbi:MAG: murein L,D-transpeptidase catalytic domain family protein [Luteimonas sp.]
MRILHMAVITTLALAAGCSTTNPRAAMDQAVAIPVSVPSSSATTAAVPPTAHSIAAPTDAMLDALQRVAPAVDPGVLALALAARQCAVDSGEVDVASSLAVIDYSLPSTARRLWVFDMRNGSLLHHEYVAHGQGSGENYATAFSNNDGSHQTSLGLFRTAETYIGGNGYSLRLDGLERGVNDNARSRAIVIHGAAYVDPVRAAKQGRLGRSYGCPALRQQVARVVIDAMKGRNLLFSYANDAAWLHRSRDFACSGRSASEIVADARRPRAGGGRFTTAMR